MIQSTAELVELGRPIGDLQACGCCGQHSLVCVMFTETLGVLLCSNCDTAQQIKFGTRDVH